ncbi:MBL fold metallo-hydrolase [Agromyces archimandritae]|uniref:MBL fold metallo-hydrolase n=2 Tax=Agromyces archimandritae TaxID=2781962 RepID=A0A975IQ51_9MICO|nr:MBL fold metallo-hydrolase [Agromyces archimandritae]
MTLGGTNSYVLAAPGADGVVVVDPGPADDAHLAALAARPVELILITHRHPDHVEGLARLRELTGAPSRSADPEFASGADPLADGDVVEAAGLRIEALATPGHTADSVSFVLPGDGEHGAVLTGDTILGHGSTVVAHPDGSLGDYLASLERLAGFGQATALPAHGPAGAPVGELAAAYLAHRRARLEEVRAALARLGDGASLEAVTDAVYPDVEPAIRFAAEASMRAQLAYLRAVGAAG